MTRENYKVVSPALVTGATGYVAGWIIKELLEQGVEVRAPVRDPTNDKELAHLRNIAAKSTGILKFYKADLLDEGSYAEAMEGCKIEFHTASPVVLAPEDPLRDLVEPALNGVKNVLGAATNTPSVQRVVLTSSCLAIYGDNKDLANMPNHTINEDIWNTSSSLEHQQYSYSNTVAEIEAWSIHQKQNQWELALVNPSLVFGPGLSNTHTAESFGMIKQFGDGLMKSGCPHLEVGIVDVRDLAVAHLKAGFNPDARGRNIVHGSNTSFLEISEKLRSEFPNYPLPTRTIPKPIIWLVGPCINKALTRKVVSSNIGLPFAAANSKSINELGSHTGP